jgi:hypothetical protein
MQAAMRTIYSLWKQQLWPLVALLLPLLLSRLLVLLLGQAGAQQMPRQMPASAVNPQMPAVLLLMQVLSELQQQQQVQTCLSVLLLLGRCRC